MTSPLTHGFAIQTDDTDEALRIVEDYRRAVRPLARRLVAEHLARAAVRTIDRARLDPDAVAVEGEEVVPLTAAFRDLFERQRAIEREGRRDPEVDFSCELVVFPHRSPPGRTLGLYFAEQGVYVDRLFARHAVQPYPHWSHTDRPEGLSPEEWEHRGQAWRTAITTDDGRQAPALAGLTVTCANVCSVAPSAEEVARHVPPFEERVQALARQRATRRRLGELLDETEGGGASSPRVYRLLHRAHRWAGSEQATETVRAEQTTVLNALDRTIDAERLTTPLA